MRDWLLNYYQDSTWGPLRPAGDIIFLYWLDRSKVSTHTLTPSTSIRRMCFWSSTWLLSIPQHQYIELNKQLNSFPGWMDKGCPLPCSFLALVVHFIRFCCYMHICIDCFWDNDDWCQYYCSYSRNQWLFIDTTRTDPSYSSFEIAVIMAGVTL